MKNKIIEFKPLAIEKSIRITKAQSMLLKLIVEKTQNQEKLTYQEAEKIYLTYAHRYFVNKVPARYNYWVPTSEVGNYTSRLEPMTKEEIEWATTLWLTGNIGKLVLKGYLKILPEMELVKAIS